VVLGNPGAEHRAVDHAATMDDRRTTDSAIPESGESRSDRKPCSGPECTRNRRPLPAAPNGVPEISHEWCVSADAARFGLPDVSAPCPAAEKAEPVRRASNIFHPPRAVRGWLWA
jgi:hypothetical protein